MFLNFPRGYSDVIFPSLPGALLLIRLCFLAFKFWLLSFSLPFSLSLWVFAFLIHSYTAIFREFVRGAEINMCSQSGIFNWKPLFVLHFSKRKDVLQIWHVFLSGEVGDGMGSM